MKAHLIVWFIVCASLHGLAMEMNPDEFRGTLRTALASGNTPEIERCFTPRRCGRSYWTICVERWMDEVLGVDLFNPADKRVNRNVIVVHCSGASLDDQHYPLNLDLQYIAAISLRGTQEKGDSGSVYWMGVGRAPDGAAPSPAHGANPTGGRIDAGARQRHP